VSESADLQSPDRCPRCGGAFACGAAGPEPCACTTVTLSATLQARLRRQFSGCLCLACLRELAAPGDAGHSGPA
jgi:Cysteine-rich CWC